MYCQNCGHQLPDDAKFCDNCGAPVGQANGSYGASAGQMNDTGESSGRMDGYGESSGRMDGYGASSGRMDGYGAPAGRMNGSGSPSGMDGLKFQDDMVRRDGAPVQPSYIAPDRPVSRKKQKSGGKPLFFVLCFLIVALSAGIAWEVFTLISINQGASDIEFPKLKTESTVTEADSETESAL